MKGNISYLTLAFLAGIIIGGLVFRQCSLTPQQSNIAPREIASKKDTAYFFLPSKIYELKSSRGEVSVSFPLKKTKKERIPRAVDSSEYTDTLAMKNDIAKVDSLCEKLDSQGVEIKIKYITVTTDGDTIFSVFGLTKKTLEQTLKKAPIKQATITETKFIEMKKEPSWYESKTLWFVVGLGAGAVATVETIKALK